MFPGLLFPGPMFPCSPASRSLNITHKTPVKLNQYNGNIPGFCTKHSEVKGTLFQWAWQCSEIKSFFKSSRKDYLKRHPKGLWVFYFRVIPKKPQVHQKRTNNDDVCLQHARRSKRLMGMFDAHPEGNKICLKGSEGQILFLWNVCISEMMKRKNEHSLMETSQYV